MLFALKIYQQFTGFQYLYLYDAHSLMKEMNMKISSHKQVRDSLIHFQAIVNQLCKSSFLICRGTTLMLRNKEFSIFFQEMCQKSAEANGEQQNISEF